MLILLRPASIPPSLYGRELRLSANQPCAAPPLQNCFFRGLLSFSPEQAERSDFFGREIEFVCPCLSYLGFYLSFVWPYHGMEGTPFNGMEGTPYHGMEGTPYQQSTGPRAASISTSHSATYALVQNDPLYCVEMPRQLFLRLIWCLRSDEQSVFDPSLEQLPVDPIHSFLEAIRILPQLFVESLDGQGQQFVDGRFQGLEQFDALAHGLDPRQDDGPEKNTSCPVPVAVTATPAGQVPAPLWLQPLVAIGLLTAPLTTTRLDVGRDFDEAKSFGFPNGFARGLVTAV